MGDATKAFRFLRILCYSVGSTVGSLLPAFSNVCHPYKWNYVQARENKEHSPDCLEEAWQVLNRRTILM